MFIANTQAGAEQKASEAGIDDELIGTPDKIAEEMAKFIEIGVDYFMLYIHGLHDPDVAGLITEELMPKIKVL